MLPSQSQQNPKRKAQEDNPLLNAAKKAKREAKSNASNKRKLLNAEEQPGGLFIVRAPSIAPRASPPPTNAQLPRPSSSQPHRPPSSAGAGPSKPPSKKFRADSQPPGSKQRTHELGRDAPPTSTQDDADIENDVRAMEDEADHLRRNSRAHTTIDASLTSALNPGFRFPERPPEVSSARKGKVKITDVYVPLPLDETPQIQRNKLLRGGAMAAIGNGRSSGSEETNGGGHRRKSSINSRGKRISSSFETTGVITQPHGSVSESSFYKHIDCDLPDAERIRQLLIWCSLRAASSSATPLKSQPPDRESALPPLSAKAAEVLKNVKADVARMLAERKIDLSQFPPEANGSKVAPEKQEDNTQNVTNRGWEVTYGAHIQRAVEEDEAWKKVGYVYDTYAKKVRSALKQASATPSAKAQGKQRAIDDDTDWKPREHELPESFHHGVAMAKSVLGVRSMGDDRVVGSSRRGSVGMGSSEIEAELVRRIPEIEYKLDHLRSLASAARTTTLVAEQSLDQRFNTLSLHLSARSNPPFPAHDPGSGSGAQILSTYVQRPTSGPDPMQLMRALSRVDMERPPAKVGDAARRAARQVQRAGESGVGAVGERRLTIPPPNSGQTPRKIPGTPRRGGTPARDKDR